MILVLLASFLTVALPAYGLLLWGLTRLADETVARQSHGPAAAEANGNRRRFPWEFEWHARG
jgi:hypothetical protein